MTSRLLFITTAIFEFTIGLCLIFAPSFTAELLLGQEQSSVPGTIVSRLAGAALIALAVACFRSRYIAGSATVKGLVEAMLVYNVLAMVLLLYVGFILQFSLLLVLAILTHVVLTLWCILDLKNSQKM